MRDGRTSQVENNWLDENRWLCGRDRLVHQLKPLLVKTMRGTSPTFYIWNPMCGARRFKNLRRGRSKFPLTCIACITAASRYR